jgi:clan AA aspartic protease
MKGVVDQSLRALITVLVKAGKDSPSEPLIVWIDTAFNGTLVIPREDIARMGMTPSSTAQAVLADGNVADVETYKCYLEWFGRVYQTQVVANDGKFPLLGTKLLADRRLLIDYATKSVALT